VPTIQEILEAGPLGASQIHDALVAGVDVLSGEQTVDFYPYVRTVLPLDGFVFWLKASLLTIDKLAANNLATADAVTVPGSLHYATIGTMTEDDITAVRKVDFTAEHEIEAFGALSPNVMYVATWQTPLGSFRFAFSQRGTYYHQADIHHYVGDAVYPTFERMLIDNIDDFDQRQVVSNSLPIWLKMAAEVPFVSLITSGVTLYPAFLTPPNLPPPYGTVDIRTNTTRALSAMPLRGRDGSHSQLCAETAQLAFYGLRNDEIMDFVDYVYDLAMNMDDFGIMNMPTVQDEHRRQVELAALAIKKTITFEISYVQGRMRDIARQVIQTAVMVPIPGDNPLLRQPDRIIEPFQRPHDPLQFPV